MLVDINFLNLSSLDSNYENVINFNTIDEMNSYIDSHILFTKKENIRYDSSLSEIVLSEPISNLLNYSYLFIKDPYTNKRYYYFILDRQVVNEKNTRLYLKLDVFNTYQFDVTYLTSFVERCHMPRWTKNLYPYSYNCDEGLDYGEIVQVSNPIDICKFNDSIVICSTVPLGKVKSSTPNTDNVGGGGVSSSNAWYEGKPSAKGFRFIKGYEGFASRSYKDSEGIPTIGYGVASHSETKLYNELVAESPISEERAAKVMYDLVTKDYGLKILNKFKEYGCDKQYQFDALLSLAYNSGYGSITLSNELTNAIKKDPTNESVIRPIWEKYKTNGGLSGLVARRKAECNIFFNKGYEMREITTILPNGGYGKPVTENNGNGWLPTESENSNNDFKGHKSFSNAFGDNWLCPVTGGTVSSVYGWRTSPSKEFHKGTDIACPTGTDILASKDGKVIMAGWENPNNHNQGFGLRVWIQHGDYKAVYPHMSSMCVSVGQDIKKGDLIGKVGSTGMSTGPHFHWQINRMSDNETTNPAPTLKEGDKV